MQMWARWGLIPTTPPPLQDARVPSHLTGSAAPHPLQALGERASHLHTGLTEDHSAMLPFQAQVRRPDPTIWWPEGQWNTMTVPTEVPLPRRIWKVPRGGGRTSVHVPREEESRGEDPAWQRVGRTPGWNGRRCPDGHTTLWGRCHSPGHGAWRPLGCQPGGKRGGDPNIKRALEVPKTTVLKKRICIRR